MVGNDDGPSLVARILFTDYFRQKQQIYDGLAYKS